MLKTLYKIPNLIQATIVILLFVTPFKVSNELYNGLIIAKEFWFLGVVAFILLYGGIYLLFTNLALKINLNLPDILLLAFYAWCFARACFTNYIPVLYNHKLQMLTGGLVIYFFIKRLIQTFKLPNIQPGNPSNNQTFEHSNIQTTERFDFKHFIILVFLLSGFLQAVYGLLQLYGFYPSNHNLFKITGSFFNPAPYALYLAVVFPLALGTYLIKSRSTGDKKSKQNNDELDFSKQSGEISNIKPGVKHWKVFQTLTGLRNFKLQTVFLQTVLQYVSLTTCIAIILVLPATMIRASWLGALAGSLLVLWFAIKQQIISLPRWFKNLFASKTKGSFFILGLVAIVTVSSIFLYRIKEGSSIGKSFIWEVTLGKIADKPLFGHGLGRFEADYNNWQAQYFQLNPSELDGSKGLAAGNTKYCFNEYLEMASETGIIGLILFFGLILSLVISGHLVEKNGHSIEEKSHSIVIDSHSVVIDGHSIVPGHKSLSMNDAKLMTMNDNLSKNDAQQMTINDNYITNIIFLPSLISILTCAAFSYPFYNAPVLILFFVVMGVVSATTGQGCLKAGKWWLSLSKPQLNFNNLHTSTSSVSAQNSPFKIDSKRTTQFSKPAYAILKYSASLLLITYSITIAYFQYHKSIAYQNWQSTNYAYQAGDFTGANEIYKANFEQLKYEGIFMQQYGKSLQMAKQNKQAIAVLNQASKLTSDYVLYCTLGDAYKNDNQFAKAESAYLFASRMVPYLLYPHYLLAKLYQVSRQHEKAIAKANEVLSKSPKTESMAVGEIKNEMKKLKNEDSKKQ